MVGFKVYCNYNALTNKTQKNLFEKLLARITDDIPRVLFFSDAEKPDSQHGH